MGKAQRQRRKKQEIGQHDPWPPLQQFVPLQPGPQFPGGHTWAQMAQRPWWSQVPPPPPPVPQALQKDDVDMKVKCSSPSCRRWAWTSKLALYRNTCLCGAAFSNLPFVEDPKQGKAKGAGKGKAGAQDFTAQLQALIKAQPDTESARAAKALLDAAASEASRQPKPHTTQQVTEVSAKVQRAQSAFEKAQKAQIKLASDLEKNKETLQETARALADAEHERATLFKSMIPTAAPPTGTGGTTPTIDLSAMFTSTDLDESMVQLNLGVDFDNADGVMGQQDVDELERRKSAVKKALYDTLKASFGELQEKLKEHRDSLAALREKNTKKRKTSASPPPVSRGAQGSEGQGAAPAAGGGAPEAAAEGTAATQGDSAEVSDLEQAKMEALTTKLEAEAKGILERARQEASARSSS